jgi:hypothetical protein
VIRTSMWLSALFLSFPIVSWKLIGAVIGLGLLVYSYRGYQKFRYG